MARRLSPGQIWLRQQARPARRSHVRIVALGLFGTLGAIGQAWLAAGLLAPVLGGRTLDVELLAAGFAALALVRAGLAYVVDRLGFEAGAAARRRLRSGLFVALFARGPVAADATPAGTLGSLAIDQVEALDPYFARWLPTAALAVAGPALVAAAVLTVDPLAALVLIAAGLMVPVGMGAAGLGAAAASRGQFVAMARLQSRFLDRIGGIATIVLAGQAEAEAERLQAAAQELTRRTMRVLGVAFLSSAILDAAAAAVLVLLAVRLGLRARLGLVPDPVASLVPLILVTEFFAPLRAFAAAYQDRLHAAEAAERLAAIDAAVPAGQVALPAVRTVAASGVAIAFDDVCLTRDPARGPVLRGLSFRVPAGETAILIGPSGAGKTTVIELLLGFLRPESGQITLNGADLASITPQALSRMTAWIGQRPVLFAGSIRDNIRFGRDDASETEIEAAARAAGLAAVTAALPQGLDTPIGEQGYGLSGGQAQRVAIARAFVRDAPLLLLDEPTAHLDPATEADVLDSLRRLTVGRTVVLASHSSAASAFAGRRIVLDDIQGNRARGAA